MTSFYDWYADLPVASPQVFGDQTDVPSPVTGGTPPTLMMWGSNVPPSPAPRRALDGRGALPRHQGGDDQPGLRRQHQVRRRVDAVRGRHRRGPAMAMGHVILTECFVEQRVPFFVDYVPRYTDLAVPGQARSATALVPARTSPPPTWGGLQPDTENAAFKPAFLDSDHGPRCRNGAGLPLRRRGPGQVEPRPRRPVPAPRPADGGETALITFPLRRPRRAGDACRRAACRCGGSANTWWSPPF